MVELGSSIVIRRPDACDWQVSANQKTYEVDLATIHSVESRRRELVTASGRAVLELSVTFDEGYDSACRLHAKTLYEEEMATIASRKRLAILMRDVFPSRIKDRGLASSRSPLAAEDIRKAMLYEDDEFVALEQYRAALGAIKELLFGKMMSLTRMCKQLEGMTKFSDTHSLPGERDPDGDRIGKTAQHMLEQNTVTTPRTPRFGRPRED